MSKFFCWIYELYAGSYVKDLLCLGRDMKNVIIVDNSPHSYIFQPDNAIPVSTFINNMEDNELLTLWQILEEVRICTKFD